MNWFDLVVIIIAIVTLIKGFSSGLIMQLAMLGGLILGAIFTGQLSAVIAPKLISLTNSSPHIIGPLSYIIAFILIIVLLVLLGRMIQSAVDAIKLSTINRILGAFFCCAKWLVLFSILLNILIEFDQKKSIIKEDVRENAHTYPLITELAQIVVPYLRFDWIN